MLCCHSGFFSTLAHVVLQYAFLQAALFNQEERPLAPRRRRAPLLRTEASTKAPRAVGHHTLSIAKALSVVIATSRQQFSRNVASRTYVERGAHHHHGPKSSSRRAVRASRLTSSSLTNRAFIALYLLMTFSREPCSVAGAYLKFCCV